VPNSKQEIIDNFKNYIQSRGGNYSDWYIGIACDPEDLFLQLQNLDNQCWDYTHIYDPQVARQILDYFINTLGIKETVSSADATADIIYVYKRKVPKE
jgi:hypothetical protein